MDHGKTPLFIYCFDDAQNLVVGIVFMYEAAQVAKVIKETAKA